METLKLVATIVLILLGLIAALVAWACLIVGSKADDAVMS